MGKNSNTISPLGMGTSQIASLGRGINHSEAKRLFDTALDYQVTTIDTADTYGSGDSERMIGKAIQAKRSDFYVITKAGFPHVHLPGFLSPLNQIGKKVLQRTGVTKSYSKKYLIQSLEKSLKRLSTDYVDAFLLHEPLGADLLAFDDFWEALDLIKKKGMANHIGISTNDSSAYIIASKSIKLDLVETGMPYGQDENSSVFSRAKKDQIPVVLNEVLKPYKFLLENAGVVALLREYGKLDQELIGILLAHSIYEKKGQCALIGTRNPNHLIQNVMSFRENDHLNEVFKELSILL
jgi:pyridoxine 4-dehydrogenase